MVCELSNGVITQHGCEWIFGHALFGWLIQILFYIAIVVGIIYWIIWVTKKCMKK